MELIKIYKGDREENNFIHNETGKDARINILQCTAEASKKIMMVAKWLDYIATAPQGTLIITGASKETIYNNVLVELFKTVGTMYYKYAEDKGELIIFGRRIKVIGASSRASEIYLHGGTYAGAYCDELQNMPNSFFIELLQCCNVEGSKIYATTTI